MYFRDLSRCFFLTKWGPPPIAWEHPPAAAVRGSRSVTWRVGSIQSPNDFHMILNGTHGKSSKFHSEANTHVLRHFEGSFSAIFYQKGAILTIVLQITATNRCQMVIFKGADSMETSWESMQTASFLLPHRRPLGQVRRLQNHGNDEVLNFLLEWGGAAPSRADFFPRERRVRRDPLVLCR